MQFFITSLVVFWGLTFILYSLGAAAAASRSPGVKTPINWWLVVLVTGFCGTAIALMLSGLVALL